MQLPRVRIVLLLVGVIMGLGLGYTLGYVQLSSSLVQAQKELVEAKSQLLTTRGELETTGLELAKVRGELETALKDLEAKRAELSVSQSKLQQARARIGDLEGNLSSTLAELQAVGDELNRTLSALRLQADAWLISMEEVDVMMSDASLLLRKGFREARAGRYGDAVAYFEEAVSRFEGSGAAQGRVSEKLRGLADEAPEELRGVYADASRWAESDVSFIAALAAEYSGVAKLYGVIGDLVERGEEATQADRQRWLSLLDEAELDLEEALRLLDEGSAIAPELSKGFEASRMDVQDWLDVIADVRRAVAG